VLSDTLGIVHIVERAATVLRGTIALQFWQAPLIPELHGQADDRTPLVLKYRCHRGGIDTTRHGYGNQAGRGFRDGCRKGIELDRFGHFQATSIVQQCPFESAGRNFGKG
jgi:hypothetical protein